jgi:hypothetical protein
MARPSAFEKIQKALLEQMISTLHVERVELAEDEVHITLVRNGKKKGKNGPRA